MTTGTMTQAPQNGGLRLKTDPRQVQFKHLLESDGMQRSLQAALPKHLSAARLIRVVLGAMQRTPELLNCTPESVLLAIMQSAALGMEPDGILGQGYLIPYGKQCQFIIGYRGLCQLARQSGQVVNIWAEVVFEKDHFDYDMGLDPKLTHKRNDEVDDPGALRYAYACARFKDGSTQFVVMNRREVEKARGSSAAAKSRSSPWATHEAEMWKKTAVRRLCKMLPLSVEVRTQIAAEDHVDLTGQPMRLPDLPSLPDLPEMPAIEGTVGPDADSGHDRPQTGESPDPELADAVDMDLANCQGISDCDEVKATWLKRCKTDADRTMVAGKCEAKADEIRASRGERSNAK